MEDDQGSCKLAGRLKPEGRGQSGKKQSESTQVNMSTKLFVGNLSYDATENDLNDLFSQYGSVIEVNLMLDRVSGRPRGFAFVTMGSADEAQAATEGLNGKEWQGRALTVNEARPREERPSSYSGGGGGGGRSRNSGGSEGRSRY
jgi:cold-inducible RNA-binding protein